MRSLQMAISSTVIAMNVIAMSAPIPIPIKGAIVLLAFWITGANIGFYFGWRR